MFCSATPSATQQVLVSITGPVPWWGRKGAAVINAVSAVSIFDGCGQRPVLWPSFCLFGFVFFLAHSEVSSHLFLCLSCLPLPSDAPSGQYNGERRTVGRSSVRRLRYWGRYHGGRRPSSDDSPTVILPSALDKPEYYERYHRRRTCSHTSPRRSPTMVTLLDTRFVECRWWNGGWTAKTVVT